MTVETKYREQAEHPAPAAEPAAHPSRWQGWWRHDIALSGMVAVVWQVVMTGYGAVVERAFSHFQQLANATPPPPPSLLQHTYRWDAEYFATIPHGRYQIDPQSPAFYPLFAVLARGVELAGLGLFGILAAGLLLNTAATCVAVHTLREITRRVAGDTASSWVAVAILLSAPTAFYLHVFYSEATFVALGFTAYLCALRRRWVPMGLCLMPLTASRITALLFVGLCFLEFWRAHGWNVRRLASPHLLWFPAGLLGFACYALYLHLVNGDALAMFHAYDAGPFWSFHVFDPNIAATLAAQVTEVVDVVTGDAAFTNHTFVDQVLPLAGLAGLVTASGYLVVVLRGDGVPLAGFGAAALVMFTLNSNLVSVHRYVLPCLTIPVAAALLAARHPTARPVLLGAAYVGVLLQSALVVLFVSNQWAG